MDDQYNYCMKNCYKSMKTVGNNILEIIHMPDQNKISMYPEFGTFFPSAYTALKVFLSFYQPENLENIIIKRYMIFY